MIKCHDEKKYDESREIDKLDDKPIIENVHERHNENLDKRLDERYDEKLDGRLDVKL